MISGIPGKYVTMHYISTFEIKCNKRSERLHTVYPENQEGVNRESHTGKSGAGTSVIAVNIGHLNPDSIINSSFTSPLLKDN